MRYKLLLLAAGLLSLSVASFGQRSSRSISFDTKSNTSSSRSSAHHAGRHQREDGKNSLTIGLISWFNGYLPVHYERALTSFLSLQVGAGPTFRSYGNDFGQLIFEDGLSSDYFGSNPYYQDIEDHYASYKYRTARLGYYLSASPRFYLRDNLMNGVFIAPLLEYKRYNYAAQLIEEQEVLYSSVDEDIPHVSQTMKEYMKCLDLSFTFGGHYQTSNHLVFSWLLGLGVRNMTAHRLDLGYYLNNSTTYTTYAVNHARDYKGVRPLISFDFRIGGWY